MFALLLTAVVVAGFLRCVLRRRTVVEYYVCLYVCALLVFPGSRQQRYMVPLIPFFWFYFLTALDAALDAVLPPSRPPRSEAGGGGGSDCRHRLPPDFECGHERAGQRCPRRPELHEPATPDRFRDALAWIQAHTPADSVFMWAKPSLGYVLAGRRAVKIPGTRPEAIRSALRDLNVDYVVVHPTWKGAQPLERVMERYPEHRTMVHQDGGVAVYRMIKRPSTQ